MANQISLANKKLNFFFGKHFFWQTLFGQYKICNNKNSRKNVGQQIYLASKCSWTKTNVDQRKYAAGEGKKMLSAPFLTAAETKISVLQFPSDLVSPVCGIFFYGTKW